MDNVLLQSIRQMEHGKIRKMVSLPGEAQACQVALPEIGDQVKRKRMDEQRR